MHTRLYALLVVFAIGGCDSTTTRTIRVFERRGQNAGRQIDLHVVVLHALGRPVAPDPIVVFTGGPGLSTTEDTRYWARVTARLRPHHDVILVDQRGTGGSAPLSCNLFETGRPKLVCGNTAAMLSETRYAGFFTVTGDRARHFGTFDCAPPLPATGGACC